MKQPDKMTAYYYRAAHKQIDDLHLDNQMQRLLYHARQNGLNAFSLYVDNGYSGLNLDRPALALMQQHMSDGHINAVVTAGLDRISRNTPDVLTFAGFAAERGVTIETLNGDHATLDWSRKLYEAIAAKAGDCK